MSFIDLARRRAGRKARQAIAPQAAPPQWDPQVLRALLELLPRGEAVLLWGVGAWGPELAAGLVGRTRSVAAVDPDPERLARVQGFCELTLGARLDARAAESARALGGTRFDAVIVTDALVTHPDPAGCLEAAAGLLAPGGRLYAVVPNVLHADSRLALLAGALPKQLAAGPAQHLYTRDGLRERLAVAGLEATRLVGLERAPLGPDSGLVAALFAPAVLEALATDEARAAFYLVEARRLPAAALLHALFLEQAELQEAVRNQLAVAARTQQTLEGSLATVGLAHAEGQATIERLTRELDTLMEQAQRLEHTVQRLNHEAFQLRREFEGLQASRWHRVGRWLRLIGPSHQPPRAPDWLREAAEPAPWKHDPAQPRYEARRKRSFFG